MANAPTIIDATKPADGIAAVKGDLRSNLARISNKLGGVINLKDCGAVLDGITDDTPALQAAINYSNAGGPDVIWINGVTVIDYAALSPKPTSPISLHVDGHLKVKSTLIVGRNLNIIGKGGYTSGAQFLIGPTCLIGYAAGFSGGGPPVQMLDYGYMEGVVINIENTGSGQPCLLIGRQSYDQFGDFQGQTANVRLERCGVNSINGPTAAIKIENTFWIWINNFMAGCTSGPSIWIADSFAAGSGQNPSALMDIRNGVISSGGIVIGTAGAPDSGGIHFWFDQIHHENVAGAFITFAQANRWTSDLKVSRVAVADPTAGGDKAIVDNTIGSPIYDMIIDDCQAAYNDAPPFVGVAPAISKMSLFQTLRYAGVPYNLFSGRPVKTSFELAGEAEFCDAYAGSANSPQMLPADAVVLLPYQDIDVYPTVAGITRTAAQRAPDGSLTATKMVSTGTNGTSAAVSISGITAHWIFVGMWIRSNDEAKSPTLNGNDTAFAWQLDGGSSILVDGLSQTWPRRIDSPRSASTKAGWVFVSDIVQVTAGSSPTGFTFHIMCGLNRDNNYWKPFAVALPVAQYNARDVGRLASKLRLVNANARPGVCAQFDHQTFRTGAGTTAQRPNAATVGAGAQWFDLTLNKPIWSNGTSWVTYA